MALHTFSIIVSGVDIYSDDFEEVFFHAGCDDAIIRVERGALILSFDREAVSFSAALESAMSDVRTAGAKVVRIEPDNLVTMADVAKRLDRSRSAVSQYVAGTRRERFPAPVVRVTAENPLWDWVQVLEWLARERDPSVTDDMLAQARAIKRASETRGQSLSVDVDRRTVTATIPTGAGTRRNLGYGSFGINPDSAVSLIVYDAIALTTFNSNVEG